jgi:protein-L-isoaspartate(D-aspartate) O-methyltransferase
MDAGTGDDAFADLMVRRQIEERGVTDGRVLSAMRKVPRRLFLPSDRASDAYGDYPLPIGHGQTISQPYMVAFMTEALGLGAGARVLEIGTGSGYQAAVLAELAAKVYSVERIAPLQARAATVLRSLGYGNVDFLLGDGCLGWPEHAPYDGILVTAAAPALPPALAEQLADGGVLVIPLGDPRGFQELSIVRRTGDRFETRRSIGCRFVPLVGRAE